MTNNSIFNEPSKILLITSKIPTIMAVIAIITNIFGGFLILKKSPKTMERYKYVLLAMMLISFYFDISFSILVEPVPLPGTEGVQMIGILSKWFSEYGNILCPFAGFSLCFQSYVIIIAFTYREHSVTMNSLNSTVTRIAQILVYLVWQVVAILLYWNACTPDSNARVFMKNLGVDLYAGCALWVVVPQKRQAVVMFSISCVFLGVGIIIAVLRSIHKIRRTLSANQSSMSENSIRIQRMFLRALIWQSAIPFIILITPCFVMVLIVYIMPLFIENNYTTLQRDLSTICLTTPCFYSPAHVISMIYFTVPYKKYCVDTFYKVTGIKKVEISSNPIKESFSNSSNVVTSLYIQTNST